MRDSLPVNAGRRYFAAADVLRILCIFTIAWFHIWQQSWLDPPFRIAGHYFDLQRIVRRGYMLVDLTLMLTGFLLYRPLVRAGGRIADVKGFLLPAALPDIAVLSARGARCGGVCARARPRRRQRSALARSSRISRSRTRSRWTRITGRASTPRSGPLRWRCSFISSSRCSPARLESVRRSHSRL